LEAFDIRHSGLDPESRISVWIPAFAGMTTLIYGNIYATFRYIHISTAMLTKSMNDCQDRPVPSAWPPALEVEIEPTNSLKNVFPMIHSITPAYFNLR
jgi:hypothetical protein